MQKQNHYINSNWLALMHGLSINPMLKRIDNKVLSQESFNPELVRVSNPKMLGYWHVDASGKLTLTYK
ncbi:MAG: hypothetical protein KDJ52_08365 [Anaerolineae bacterium]|nr:hypothetical protein [Anaerolineae bacterium]